MKLGLKLNQPESMSLVAKLVIKDESSSLKQKTRRNSSFLHVATMLYSVQGSKISFSPGSPTASSKAT